MLYQVTRIVCSDRMAGSNTAATPHRKMCLKVIVAEMLLVELVQYCYSDRNAICPGAAAALDTLQYVDDLHATYVAQDILVALLSVSQTAFVRSILRQLSVPRNRTNLLGYAPTVAVRAVGRTCVDVVTTLK